MGFKNKIFLNNNPPQLEDDDLNGYSTEFNNTFLTSGQTPDNGDLLQTSKAMAIYTAGSDFYLETGSANAYILDTSGAFQAPIDYFIGMRIRFIPSNTNTGASTVNVESLGVKNLRLSNGVNDPSGGNIKAGTVIEAIYDGTNFLIVSGLTRIFETKGTAGNTTFDGVVTDLTFNTTPVKSYEYALMARAILRDSFDSLTIDIFDDATLIGTTGATRASAQPETEVIPATNVFKYVASGSQLTFDLTLTGTAELGINTVVQVTELPNHEAGTIT
jgi:hypothetical protein